MLGALFRVWIPATRWPTRQHARQLRGGMIPMPDTTSEVLALAEALGGRPAPCQLADPEMWFDTDPAPAITACQDCHARAECLDLAVAHREKYGVFGATNFERKRVAKSVAA